MPVRLVISAYHILLDNRMSIFYASGYTLPVDVMLIKELICLTICIRCVYHHMRHFNTYLIKKASDVHHYQGELLVAVNYNRFPTILGSMRKVNKPVRIAIKATCLNPVLFYIKRSWV